jgi:phosphatidate cytidylyltransferase
MQGYTGGTSKDVATNPRNKYRYDALRTRVISAVFIGFVTILTGLLGGLWFTGFILVVTAAATYEMLQLMRASGFAPSLAFGFAAMLLAFAAVRFDVFAPYLPALITVLLLGSLAWQMRHREGKPIADWAITLAGGAYLGWTSAHLAASRELANGVWWLVIAIGITWLADSGAYFAGQRFGRHKLAPVLSPKKTWEGYFGGVIAAVLGGVVVGLVSPLGVVQCVVAAFLVGALGTLGDLVESMFKRQANAKDSGHLIPGHGGAFDRIDSLLWAGVVVYYFATLTATFLH